MIHDSEPPAVLQQQKQSINHQGYHENQSAPRPPSIILRSSAKQLVSTTSTAAYCPVESNQFNTSLSKQPIILAPHRIIQNQPRQSFGQPGITLVSNSPNVSVRSIPPSSRVLIRPSSSLSNLQEHRQSHQLIRKQPVSTKIGGQYITNMLNVMKVQLEQMNINFSNKLFQQIQKQNEYFLINLARQIQKLERALRENESIINNKDQEIQILKDKIRLTNLNKRKEVEQMKQLINQNHQYLTWKIRDMKSKLLVVADGFAQIKPIWEEKQVEKQKEGLLVDKVQEISCKLNSIISNQFGEIRNKLSEISQKSTKHLEQIEGKVSNIRSEMNSNGQIRNTTDQQELNVYAQKLKYLQKLTEQIRINSTLNDQKDIQQAVTPIRDRQTKIESNLKYLQTDVSHKLLNKLHLEEQFKLLCTKLIESQRVVEDKHRQYQQKTIELNKHIKTLQQQQVARKQATKTRQNVVQKRVNVSQPVIHRIPSVQSIQSLNVSGSSHRSKVQLSHYYSQISGSMRRDNNTHSMKNLPNVESPISPKLNSKLINLQTMLKKSKRKLPLRCEIDEAGILKDYDEGIYIFSQNGDVFTLNQNQQKMAVKNRLISL